MQGSVVLETNRLLAKLDEVAELIHRLVTSPGYSLSIFAKGGNTKTSDVAQCLP